MAQPIKKPAATKAPATKPGIKMFQKLPEDTPVLPSLFSTMRTELLVNDSDIATVFHEKDLPQAIWWAEYDIDLAQLYFVTVQAKIIGLGFKIHDPLHEKLQHAKKVNFMKVSEDDKIGFPFVVPLVVRHYTLRD